MRMEISSPAKVSAALMLSWTVMPEPITVTASSSEECTTLLPPVGTPSPAGGATGGGGADRRAGAPLRGVHDLAAADGELLVGAVDHGRLRAEGPHEAYAARV